MKKTALSTIILTAIITMSAVTSFAKETSRTGKNLSELTKSAIKKVTTTDLLTGVEIPAADRITPERVVEVTDMSTFCTDQKVSAENCKKMGMAFTLNQRWPVYINADPKAGSQYDTYNNMFMQSSQIAFAIAPILYHESFHARGEKQEAVCYREEFAFLKLLKDQGALNNAPWASTILSNTEANLQYAETHQSGDIKIAKNK